MVKISRSLVAALTLTLLGTGQQLVFAEGEPDAELQARVEAAAATKDFLGVKWGFAVGAALDLDSGDRVDKATVVNNVVRIEEQNNAQPRVFLELHNFRPTPKRLQELRTRHAKAFARNAEGKGAGSLVNWAEIPAVEHPRYAWGPWVGVQSSKDQAIDAFALGIMGGWRKAANNETTFGLGIGLLLDPKVQVLGDGLKANQPLPSGETAVRLKKEERLGLAIVASVSF